MQFMKNALTTLLLLAALVVPPAAADAAQKQTTPSGDAEMDEIDKAIEKEMKEKSKEPEKPKKPIPQFNMVFVKGGCFNMGDWTGEGDEDELPAHEVCVGDFYIAETEVTLGLAEAVMGIDIQKLDPNRPLTYMNGRFVTNFLKEINTRAKRFYRLPTEAEWEYAAREGGRKIRWSGTDNEDDVEAYAWFEDNADGETRPVKTKKPNRLGLYDMSGNASELVEDYYDPEYYKKSAKKNPGGPELSPVRSVRGGAFSDPSYKLRTTFRYALEVRKKYHALGFRLAE